MNSLRDSTYTNSIIYYNIYMLTAHILPAVSLIGLSMSGCNTTVAVTILTFAVSLIGAYSSGYFQNPIDVAPNFAGKDFTSFPFLLFKESSGYQI